MKALGIILLTPILLFAQPFEWQQEYDVIPMIVEGDTLSAAWLGGYQNTCPSFGDLDSDGDLDLLLGRSNGTIDYWKNNGTPTQENITLEERAIQGLDINFWAVIQLCDMDSDGDLDLFADRGNYPMIVFNNVGGPISPYFEVEEDTLFDTLGNYIDGTDFCLADINGDGDKDLFVGVWYVGSIKYYENIGDSTDYVFALVDTNFAGILTSSWSSPTFCDLDADGDLDLFIGMNGGGIMYYRNDGTPLQYDFTYVTNEWLGIDVGDKAAPDFADIDADGDYDLFIGKDNDNDHTVPGALHFWRNEGTPLEPQMVQESQMYLTLDFENDSEPGIIDVNFDDKGDLFVHAYYISWLKDIGTPEEPVFELQSYNTAGTGFLASSVGYGDLNGDQHEDMVVVYGWSGNVQFWINNGDTLNPEFDIVSSFSIGQIAGLSDDELRELVDLDREIIPNTKKSNELDPKANDFLEKCLRAAMELDSETLEKTLLQASSELTQPMLLEGVLEPLMLTIGEYWREGKMRVVHEHMASAIIRTFLGNMIGAYQTDQSAPTLIVTTPA